MAASRFTSVLTGSSVTSAASHSSKSKLRSHEWQCPFLPSLPPEEERRVSPLHPLPRPAPAPEPCLQPRRGRSLQGSARVSPALALTSLYSHGLRWQGPPLCAHKPAPPTLFVSRNYHVAVLSHKARAPELEWKKPCDAQWGRLGGFQLWRSVTCCHGDALKRETHVFLKALLAKSLTFCWRESLREIEVKLRSGQDLIKWRWVLLWGLKTKQKNVQ